VCEILNEMAASQSSGVGSAHQATASRTNAREALRESLQAVTRTARAMALDTPGLENKFRLPRSGSDQALLNTARAFVADATPLKPDFIRHELAASFIEDLQADIADLERAIGGQNTGRDAHVTATASIDSTVERGMVAVTRLDAIVRNKFRDNPATLAAWESARHVERTTRPSRRPNGDAEGNTPEGDDKT
ncbi:MAG TPA: hypothetical protein VEX60_06580, partial [Pyrinomonadaceae bacterium]|nr:hypothetical protein [Pyrinomonadaceae bacterium]